MPNEVNVTADVMDSSPAPADPFEADRGEPAGPPASSPEGDPSDGGQEPSDGISNNANRRIQQLVSKGKEYEKTISQLQQQNAQMRQYMIQQLNQPKNQPSTAPPSALSYDPESENIIKDLGGDDTAKKLYDVLGRRFGLAAKEQGLAREDEVLSKVDQRINAALGTVQATQAVPNRIQELVGKGRLDAKEAQWVQQKVVEAAQQEPRWLGNAQLARQLVNTIVEAGYDSGDIAVAVKKSRPANTLVSPGQNGGGAPEGDNLSDLRAAAQRFRSLRSLNDKQLKQLGGKMPAGRPASQQSVAHLVKGQ